MYQLIAPDAQAFTQWSACLEEFGDGPIDGSGFQATPDLSEAAFTLYMEDRLRAADTSIAPPENWVHCNFYWIVDGAGTGELVGFLALRHELTPHLLEQGGHIGYSVRPSARNKGVASAALVLGLTEARNLGIGRVLLTVKESNVASQRVIERAGGVYEDSRQGFRRYWFHQPNPWGQDSHS